jgi:hypothetical protein
LSLGSAAAQPKLVAIGFDRRQAGEPRTLRARRRKERGSRSGR